MVTIPKIQVIKGDITALPQRVDYIVCSCNPRLVTAGGVCGAIHKAAGRDAIDNELKRNAPFGAHVGEIVWSQAGVLDASHILHCIGPVWHGGGQHEGSTLLRLYRDLLNHCGRAQSIALPSISTGIYGMPLHVGAAAFAAAANLYKDAPVLAIYMVCLDEATYESMSAAVEALGS